MKKHKIIIVDDSPVDRKIMKKIIETSLHQVEIVEADDATDLLDKLIMQNIKVIILDLILGYQSGLTVLNELQNHHATRDIPVIIISNISEPETIREALSMQAYDYFEKPLTNNDINFALSLKVNNALQLKLYTDRVNYLKNHDNVTNLYSRQYAENQIESVQEEQLPAALLILDINGLKVINDAYGYKAGDQIIKTIGEVLSRFTHRSNCISKWGSDEFALLISNTDEFQVNEIIQELIDELSIYETVDFELAFGYKIIESIDYNSNEWIRLAEDHLMSNKVISYSSHRSDMIKSINRTLHQKNPREEFHSKRVSEICRKIAKSLNLSEFEQKRVEVAALMHDIGKIAIDERLLNKTGKLTDDEWYEMKKHPEIGFRILSTSVDTIDIANAVLNHHERWDGTGYPMGLSGEKIPFMARIITVADAYDAMTSYRTYKSEMSNKEAFNELLRCKGTQFDPTVIDAFVKISNQL